MDNWLAQAVIGGVVASTVIYLARWAYGKAIFWNDRISLAINRAELRKIERLGQDKLHVMQFLLIQVLCCFGILGIAIMLAPLAFMADGAKWIVPGLGLLGLSIYGCVIYPLGMIARLRKGEGYITRQKALIDRTERRLDLTSQKA
ncbi:hypothetical protein XAP3CFBP6996_008145 [Xanthomonas citri pv. fuscans CFBP 6996]|uniref:hypothetical protein n=2 Tax=Xanthomonas citri TaxID=346 RepID=UPI000C19F2DE|nr:hypothetical protein [Xanthomonas citri]ATS51222.1 hypothetical protein XcfCFBP6992P_10180 [Xanthomonas citri pv. phaseoli var. fuscans]ATS56954.1 hypothetical protein XcfCFBP6994P_18890 [Xanthomonas citri pv. phaseoli var. fuscans]ATS59036.1 hypothetical protein XcfCFBP6996P_06840 [Xanthomonas citri pv. phaseoli var. fuscans]PTY31890.1 hypothetical protein XAP3CFBP6996_008145 [Xanthomonas citri pv. fuscans CFBP 6996]SOO18815.1 conserved membrane hypothetical protein [Xanthomonas citri pv. 